MEWDDGVMEWNDDGKSRDLMHVILFRRDWTHSQQRNTISNENTNDGN